MSSNTFDVGSNCEKIKDKSSNKSVLELLYNFNKSS